MLRSLFYIACEWLSGGRRWNHLVNKPLQAAGMSADNVRGWESGKWTFGREAKLRGQMWNFEDNLSAKGIISRHTSKPERSLFIL